ncbi:transmembrane protein 100 [Spea bombifrons]|uniref:transmembrane protein 100 n=1 Tax=Spea bombifrons TaxID=233779 RepID=UPI00234BF9AD|nr:transmembrane protein 100 [Spea bombifrons]
MEQPIKDHLGSPKGSEPIMIEKANNDYVITAIPRLNETQLTAATGGAELSCYRCTIPFGVVILIAGVVVTAVAYSFNSHGSIISVFGLVLLSSGLLLVCSSALCWKVRQRKKRAKRRESQTALVANQRSLLA